MVPFPEMEAQGVRLLLAARALDSDHSVFGGGCGGGPVAEPSLAPTMQGAHAGAALPSAEVSCIERGVAQSLKFEHLDRFRKIMLLNVPD